MPTPPNRPRSAPRKSGTSREARRSWEETYRQSHYDELPWFQTTPASSLVEGLRKGWVPRRGQHLDVGCGAGTNVLWLAKQGVQATGVDLAPGAIDAALERTRRGRVGGAHFVVGDVLELPFPTGSFDSASDIGCFHTLPADRRGDYAEELARVLRPGGKHLLSWIAREDEREHGPPHRLSVREVAEAVEEHFQMLRVEFHANPARAGGRQSYSALLERRTRHQPPPR